MIRTVVVLAVPNEHYYSIVFVLCSQVLQNVRYVMTAFWDTFALAQTAVHAWPASLRCNHGMNGDMFLGPAVSIHRRKGSKFIQSLPIARHAMPEVRCTIVLCRRTRMRYVWMMVMLLCHAAASRYCRGRRVAISGDSPMDGRRGTCPAPQVWFLASGFAV